MEYNLPSEIVKDLNFGDQAKKRIIVLIFEEKKVETI